MAKPIAIEHVFKVFGDAPQAALDLVRQGCSKQEILERTGQSIGVFNASFRIEAGEIFVVMGLSGSGKSTLVRLLNRRSHRRPGVSSSTTRTSSTLTSTSCASCGARTSPWCSSHSR